MPESIAQQLPETRLRRWWRGFYAAVEGMEISGATSIRADRIDDLENRVWHLQAARGPDGRTTTSTHR